MPENDRTPPFKIADGLGQAHVWQLVEDQITLVIGCVACAHMARWPPRLIGQKLSRQRGATLTRVAARLRCSRCRSCYVRLWRG